MGGSSKPAPPPNYQPIAQAMMANSAQQNATSQQQLQFAREQHAAQEARANRQQQTLDELVREQRERQRVLDQQAAADRARYEQTFQPLEDELVRETKQYTPELIAARAEAAAGRAAADISTQYAMARSAAQDRLESYGIDPGQVRQGALDLSSRTQEAAARSGGANMQRDATTAGERAYGAQLRGQALALGQHYVGNSMNAYNMALNNAQSAASMGQAGLGNYLQNLQAYTGLAGSAPQWAQTGNQAMGQAGDMMNQGYKNYLDYYKAKQASGQSSGWGTALGLIGGVGLSFLAPGISAAPGMMAMGKGLGNKFAGAFGYEEGGAAEGQPKQDVPHQGVPITPDQSPSRGVDVDDVPARLNVGEFIVPNDVVKWKGEEFFQRLIEGSRKKKQEAPAKPTMGAVPVDEAPVVSTVPQPPPIPPTAVQPQAYALGGVAEEVGTRLDPLRSPLYEMTPQEIWELEQFQRAERARRLDQSIENTFMNIGEMTRRSEQDLMKYAR